jgi:plasmid stabilization system protein ParE
MVKEIKWSPKAVEQYKAVIDYYRLHSGNSLRILSIFDTRQNPTKRPF